MKFDYVIETMASRIFELEEILGHKKDYSRDYIEDITNEKNQLKQAIKILKENND